MAVNFPNIFNIEFDLQSCLHEGRLFSLDIKMYYILRSMVLAWEQTDQWNVISESAQIDPSNMGI